MTNKRVYCKDCKWYVPPNASMFGDEIITSSNPPGCLTKYHPVFGVVDNKRGLDLCLEKNANCDCRDYEAKDGEA